VGDTVGPAGIVRAMRAVPMFAEFAEAIKAFCPNAWTINYTNPMSACTGALYKVFPGIKAFGCCHEVFHSQRLLAKMLALEIGSEGIDRREIRTNVIGVNHFTWIDRASSGTRDLVPLFAEYAQKYARDGFALDESDKDPGNCFRNMNRVCFDLFLRYHAIPAAGDRHIAEFMPPWYLKNPDSAAEWGFRLTPVSYRKGKARELAQKSARIAGGQEKFMAKRSGEEGTEQIKALLGLAELATNVNLPNAGQAPGLPIGAVVETNALFGRDSLRPILAGELPPAVNSMVSRHAANQALLVDACVGRDIELAFSVFLNDSLMTLGVAEAEELFGRMLRNTKKYLPGWAVPG
jgi:alpha-galactosidase